MVPFENQSKMSGFRKVTWPFENQPSKCQDFEWIRFSNGRITDPHCNDVIQHKPSFLFTWRLHRRGLDRLKFHLVRLWQVRTCQPDFRLVPGLSPLPEQEFQISSQLWKNLRHIDIDLRSAERQNLGLFVAGVAEPLPGGKICLPRLFHEHFELFFISTY